MRRTDLGTRITLKVVKSTLGTLIGLLLVGLVFGLIGLYAIEQLPAVVIK